MRISDWSSDVCSSDLFDQRLQRGEPGLDERGVPAPLVRAGRGQGVARQRQRVAQLAVPGEARPLAEADDFTLRVRKEPVVIKAGPAVGRQRVEVRSEEHTSELQSLMRISYAVFCLKKKKTTL